MSNYTVTSGMQTTEPQHTTPFVRLPHWILDSGASGGAAKLYCIIAMFAHDDNRTHRITRVTLAEVMRTSTRTVSTYLKELVELGAVTVIPQFDGPKRSGSVYVLNEDGEEL